MMNIYVGNLPYGITEDELRALFEEHGEVSSANVIIDRQTGRSKGFGFVEMNDGGEAAIGALNDTVGTDATGAGRGTGSFTARGDAREP